MYLQYLRAVGWGLSTWIFIGYIGQYASSVGSSLWLSDWTNDALRLNLTQNQTDAQTYPASKRDLRIGVYGALGVSQGKPLKIEIINECRMAQICCPLSILKNSRKFACRTVDAIILGDNVGFSFWEALGQRPCESFPIFGKCRHQLHSPPPKCCYSHVPIEELMYAAVTSWEVGPVLFAG